MLRWCVSWQPYTQDPPVLKERIGMANTYWIRSHGVRKKPIHSCTLQRMYHSVTDPVKHLLLIVKEHLLIAALQHVAPPPKRMK